MYNPTVFRHPPPIPFQFLVSCLSLHSITSQCPEMVFRMNILFFLVGHIEAQEKHVQLSLNGNSSRCWVHYKNVWTQTDHRAQTQYELLSVKLNVAQFD